MQDLNDLYYFVAVVDHGGFAAAGRALGLQKSKLSRRILQVEERLGVRLLNGSSRRFSVTEIGREFYAGYHFAAHRLGNADASASGSMDALLYLAARHHRPFVGFSAGPK